MNNVIKVGVLKDSYPYSSYNNSIANGLAVDIWENVALEHNLKYKYIGIEKNIDNAFLDIGKNNIDILLGDINISKEEYNNVLFSIPYCKQQLNIFRKSKNNILHILYLIFTDKIIIYCLVFSIIIVISFTFLHKFFAKTTFSNAFYRSNIFFLTRTIPEFIKVNNTNQNQSIIKIINYIYPLISLLFYTIIFAKIVKINLNLIDNISIDELNNIKSCYTVNNNTYKELLKDMNIKPIISSINDIIEKISHNDNTYWFDDKEILLNILKKNHDITNLVSLKTPVIDFDCVICVNKKNTNILHFINKTILQLRENTKMEQLCKIYFKEDSRKVCVNIHNFHTNNL